jgi:uncharacterized membrane protein YbhN (UPF0104 family)
MSTRPPAPRVFLVVRRELRRRQRALIAGGLFSGAVVAVAATPQLLGTQVSAAFDGLGDAQPKWLWLSSLLVVATIVAWAQAWRSVIVAVGGSISRTDAVARYSIGAVVNTFLPARLGDAARIGLFSRALENRERVWTTVGAYTTIGAARALFSGALIVGGYAWGGLPLWTVGLPVAWIGIALLLAALSARTRGARSRPAHFFDAYRELGRAPRRVVPVLGWTAVATVARVGALAAIVSALGIPHALTAALLIIPTIDAASLLPLTPGAISLSTGAVALTLNGIGINATTALAVGIGYHAIEAAAAVVFGTVGGLVLLGEQRPRARHAAAALAGVSVAVAVAGALGVALLDLT